MDNMLHDLLAIQVGVEDHEMGLPLRHNVSPAGRYKEVRTVPQSTLNLNTLPNRPEVT